MKPKQRNAALSALAIYAVIAGQPAAADNHNGKQTIYRADKQKAFTGPSEIFTGKVHVTLLFPSNETAHYSGAYVTFEPGARSAWHLHPAGQHIVVTEGVGRTGTAGGHVEEIKAGAHQG